MNLEKAIEILEQHNKYRRDKNVPSIHEPTNTKELGVAIDTVVNHHIAVCDKCVFCELHENNITSENYFCELTEETIKDINQHYCESFKRI